MVRPPRQRSGPDTTPGRHNAADPNTSKASVHGQVADLAAWRQRKQDSKALHAALDWLDDRGLCACWVMPRPHRRPS